MIRSFALQTPTIADGLGEVRTLDAFNSGEISNGACHPQDALRSAGGQLHALHGALEQIAGRHIKRGKAGQLAGWQPRIDDSATLLLT